MFNGLFDEHNGGCGCDGGIDHKGGCNCTWIILILLFCCCCGGKMKNFTVTLNPC